MRLKGFISVLTICLLAGSAFAQHQHSPSMANQPIELMPEFGEHHHPVTTSNAEAQRFFNQGMVLIYGFNHDEAVRSFQRAAALDPNLAMAHWGIALAMGANINLGPLPEREKAAHEAIQKAIALLPKASEKERDFINTLAKRYSGDPQTDRGELAITYANAMRELAKKYPDDMDASTLFADSLMNLRPWKFWGKDGSPAEGTEEIVATLEYVLKHDPTHIGANHLYIHAVEASGKPERALPSATRLGKLAPGSGHLVHMPAHIYLQTGDYEESALANEAAANADRAYLKKSNAQGMYPAMYYSHNLHFLHETYNRAGRFADAKRATDQLAANVKLYLKEMPMLEAFLPSTTFTLVTFNKWDEMLKCPEPDASTPITRALWYYGRCLALSATGKLAEAEREMQIFEKLRGEISGDMVWGLNSASSVLTIASLLTQARFAQAKGDLPKAVELLRQAVAAQDALNYDEPPGWYYPIRQSLGAALLRAGKAGEAEQEFRKALDTMPRNGRLLFGLLESLKAQGKMHAVKIVEREFERAWKGADTKLRIEDL